MNWTEDPRVPSPTEAPGAEATSPEQAALYPGDTGMLPEPARRALVQLLSGPSLEGRRHPRLWPALLLVALYLPFRAQLFGGFQAPPNPYFIGPTDPEFVGFIGAKMIKDSRTAEE